MNKTTRKREIYTLPKYNRECEFVRAVEKNNYFLGDIFNNTQEKIKLLRNLGYDRLHTTGRPLYLEGLVYPDNKDKSRIHNAVANNFKTLSKRAGPNLSQKVEAYKKALKEGTNELLDDLMERIYTQLGLMGREEAARYDLPEIFR